MREGYIDIFGSMPTAERLAFEIFSWGSDPGYSGVFRDRWAKLQGLPPALVAEVAALPREGYRDAAVKRIGPHARSAAAIVEEMRSAGAAKTVLHNLLPTDPGLANDDLAAIVQAFPDDLIGFARVDPRKGEEAAREVERCVTKFGFRGVSITPFWHEVRADDPVCFPVYEACSALGVAAWIHCSVNWKRSTPLHFEHPLHLDAIACRFPDLRIIAGHGGWPWIPDMVAVAQRHPNVYIDTTAFRPRHLAVPGTGWEMLWYFMSRTLRGKVIFGSTWQLLGMPLAEIVKEARDLSLAPEAERQWMRGAAERALGLVA